MSDTIFPTLISENWKLTRTPQFQTIVQLSASGVRGSAGLRSRPLWKWTLKNGVLQAADTIQDLQAIETFFGEMEGMYDSFLWQDPDSSMPTGATVTVGGQSYWRVSLLQDSLDFDQICYQIWQLGKIEFQQVST